MTKLRRFLQKYFTMFWTLSYHQYFPKLIDKDWYGLDQAPQTRGPRKGPMRPAINFLRSRKDEKITLFQFFGEKKTIFQLLFLISLNFLFNKLIMVIITAIQLVWCGPWSLKFVFMQPSKLWNSLMRPVSQFEFETPGLDH